MTGFEVLEVEFAEDRFLARDQVRAWATIDSRFSNWPVVYTLDGMGQIYIGESLNVAARFRQHHDSPTKVGLSRARVIIDDTFNKSACLDLESFLIRLFAGDGKYAVLNGNDGITDSDYYNREGYRATFSDVFDILRNEGFFNQSIREIENSDLFKLSPFKALSEDQLTAVNDIVKGLFEDIEEKKGSKIVVQGSPGTGKTIVAIYLIKLLCDLGDVDARQPQHENSFLDDFTIEEAAERFKNFRIGLVIPQQALRKSIKSVFSRTPGLDSSMVLSAFDVGKSRDPFDLLIVDEAHRLTQRASQGSGVRNKMYADITIELFGADDKTKTQLDWIVSKSANQLFLLDLDQTVRPADIPAGVMRALTDEASLSHRHYPLRAQHRVRAGSDYVGYIADVLAGVPIRPKNFDLYDLRFFDSFSQMRREIVARDEEVGLARLVAGYAWKWTSSKDRSAYDINIDGERMKWNTRPVDWVNSKTSLQEMGSIHTIQGYDLNYTGVVIGPDIWYDLDSLQIRFDRSSYFDTNGKANNHQLGVTYSDAQILKYVQNVYKVLLTRGILGTYVYVCDAALREYFRPFFSASKEF
ncbi:DNA/RNA helicase domain-containing protein [Dermatophilaceae bacterium Sec6.4]